MIFSLHSLFSLSFASHFSMLHLYALILNVPIQTNGQDRCGTQGLDTQSKNFRLLGTLMWKWTILCHFTYIKKETWGWRWRNGRGSVGTAGALTQILITQNAGRLCRNGNYPRVCIAEHAKHVYSEWDLTNCWNSHSWIKPWSKAQVNCDSGSFMSLTWSGRTLTFLQRKRFHLKEGCKEPRAAAATLSVHRYLHHQRLFQHIAHICCQHLAAHDINPCQISVPAVYSLGF